MNSNTISYYFTADISHSISTNLKILARYASAGAVYRELLQNSNDAEATTAEIIITTSPSDKGDKKSKEEVAQIVYRNNGLPFRPQDWARLRKIAEGNPDEVRRCLLLVLIYITSEVYLSTLWNCI